MQRYIFNINDIVVWQGAITTYGTIKELVEQDGSDDVVLASKEEVVRYLSRPDSTPKN